MADGEGNRKARAGISVPHIPDKLYFRIGEVARLLSLPTHVLRFWEGEFPQLRPYKGDTGQRLYRRKDVEALLEVRRLLYDRGYTIPGARQYLAERASQGVADAERSQTPASAPKTAGQATDALLQVYTGLRELSRMLSRPAEAGAKQSGLHLAMRKRTVGHDDTPTLFTLPLDKSSGSAE